MLVVRERPAGSPPAPRGEPRPRRGHGRRFDGRARRRLPTLEPRRGASRVDARRRAQVLPEVEQHVDQPSPSLRGRSKGVRMIAAVPDGAPAPDGPIDCLRAPHSQPLEPSHERERDVALDEEVDVIALHREVNDAERFFVRGRQRTLHERKHARRSQRRQASARPQSHMHRPSSPVPRPRPMRRARTRRHQFPPRPHAPAAPAPDRRQLQLLGSLPRHRHRSRPPSQPVARGKLCSIKLHRPVSGKQVTEVLRVETLLNQDLEFVDRAETPQVD